MKYKNTGSETLIFDNDGRELTVAPGATVSLVSTPYVRGLVARKQLAEEPAETVAAGPVPAPTPVPKDGAAK